MASPCSIVLSESSSKLLVNKTGIKTLRRFTVFMHKKIAELLLSYLALKTDFCKSFQNVLMAEFVGSQVRDRCLYGYLSLHVVTY